MVADHEVEVLVQDGSDGAGARDALCAVDEERQGAVIHEAEDPLGHLVREERELRALDRIVRDSVAVVEHEAEQVRRRKRLRRERRLGVPPARRLDRDDLVRH